MNSAWCLNTAWMLKCRPGWKVFQRATRDATSLAAAQAAVLREVLDSNRDCEFGRHCGFDAIGSPREFQRRVPVMGEVELGTAVERMAGGEERVLTAEAVRLFEPTSGTGGGRKLVPYTATLRRQFGRMIEPWVYDLFRKRPAVRGGRAYWSISPAGRHDERTAAGIPIGFDDDTAYLGSWERRLLGRLLAVPPAVARLPDVDGFRFATLLSLLAADDLALVSVWSPTFLTVLLERLEPWADRLCAALRDGWQPDGGHDGIGWTFPRCPRRAGVVDRIFGAGATLPEMVRRLWPRLAVVSCWADASAALYARELARLLPGVELQPKGLIATEGAVSFPLVGRDGAALAVRSHFFEFLPERGDAADALLAHELCSGGRYEVLLTTGGGLYRYRLGDVVEVVGFEGACPLLRFRGRVGVTSDHVGEKLAEPHVRAVLDRALADQHFGARFALLVPVDARPPHYRLYVQPVPGAPPAPSTRKLAEAVEAGLAANPHYAYAVRLGQLGPVEVCLLDADGEPAWTVYERRCLERGQRAGDVKPRALDGADGWPERFEPLTMSRRSGCA